MSDARGRRYNQQIRIKSIVAEGGPVSGLYVIYSDDVAIEHYLGRSNCRRPHYNPSYRADVLLLESNNTRFGVLEAEGVRHVGLWADRKAENVAVQRLKLTTDQPDAKAQVVQSPTLRVDQSELLGFSH